MTTFKVFIETGTAQIVCGERKAKSAENAIRAQARIDGRKITDLHISDDYTRATLEGGSELYTLTEGENSPLA
jgi:hypothetical protein